MKKIYSLYFGFAFSIFFFQHSVAQDFGPLLSNRFSLGSPTFSWKALYVNNITAYGNVSIGNSLSVVGSATFTGNVTGTTANFTSFVTGPTLPTTDNSNNLATTSFVKSAISSLGSSSGGWSLLGNSGTVDGTNFIGTTDNAPLNFRINNQRAGRIDLNSNAFFGYLAGGIIGTANTATGSNALASNNGGIKNTAMGWGAMGSNTNGSSNVAMGSQALANTRTGSSLTAIGAYADVNADGYVNSTAIGYQATITGSNMIQLGNNAVTKVYAGTGNTATLIAGGLQITGGILAAGNVLTSDASGNATWQPISGGSNAWSLTGNSGTVDGTNFIGTTDNQPLNFRINNQRAGRIDLNSNAFFGYSAGGINGTANTATGSNALASNNGGINNTAMGWGAMGSNTNGSSNVAMGSQALAHTRTGSSLTAIGAYADVDADGYVNSTAIGNQAAITGSNMIQLGNNAVTKVYAGTGNTATLIAGGLQITGGILAAGNVLTSDAAGVASWQPISGGSNAWSLTGNSGTVDGTNFIGTTDNQPLNFRINNQASGRIDLSGNTFFGNNSGGTISSGNTAIGSSALGANTSGANNSAVGGSALYQNATGRFNVAVGALTLFNNVSGNSLTAIGYGADVNADGYNNSTAIGSGAVVTGSNMIQLGNFKVDTVFAGTGTNATLVAGGLKITGGTLAAGNVLTSDANGVATWQPLSGGSSSNAWSLTGNSGTKDGTNFIGTLDNEPLNFRINNQPAGRIDNSLTGNVFFGFPAGGPPGDNSNSTAVGDYALNAENGAESNSAFGNYALTANTYGSLNTAMGFQALKANTGGSENVGIGVGALQTNQMGQQLTALGYGAGVSADGFKNSTAIGYGAQVTGSNMIQLGNGTVDTVFAGTGTNTTLVAGGLKISGGTLAAGNVLISDALGNASWQPLPASSSTNAWGLTGNSGTVDGTNFIGTTDNEPLNFRIDNQPAGRIDINNNTFLGITAGTSSIGNSGVNNNINNNTAVGASSLSNNTGGENSAFGFASLFNNQSGSDNVAIGDFASYKNLSGTENTAVGYSALQNNTSGGALSALGADADVTMDGLQNSTAIGYEAKITQSNEVVLGNISITEIAANVTGITALSDGRFKKNIKDNVPGLEFINQLKPVTYNYDIKGLNAHRSPNSTSTKGFNGKTTVQPGKEDEAAIAEKEKILYTGLVAQDVETAAKKVNYNFSGLHKPQNDKDTYGLSYVDFVMPLIKATQQLSASNDSLQNQINDLQNQLNQLKAQVASLVSSPTINKENITSTEIQLSSARLEQNVPNPFNQTTMISYYVPQTAGNAMITVTDMTGKTIKSVSLSTMGSGQLTLQTSQLVAGTYVYSLYVDGNLIDTKKMLLVK